MHMHMHIHIHPGKSKSHRASRVNIGLLGAVAFGIAIIRLPQPDLLSAARPAARHSAAV
jgi:hypothetical protein